MSAAGLNALQNLPAPAKAGLIVLGGGGLLAAAYPLLGAKGVALIVLGIAIVALLLLAYRWMVKAMDKRKANPFVHSITQNSAAAPQGISEPAKRARLDDLRKTFEGGVEKFRGAGKNLYSIPWYLLVGEPGSGKTEAIRHCNVGFPPGLQDQLQGAGGTLNMNWWFTNHAVILDTAGRLMFEEAPPGQTSEWQEFLKLLKRARPNCPVNGMLLVIPADSLVRDTADQIEKKAGKIAHQLDTIQRALGVRFPVFVVITKCDLVNGFREFFDNLEDPQLQHQILGWSNPADLDHPFKPELVEEHLEQVRDRMIRRRTLMLQDPVHTENPGARRLDQVDALYAFPDSLTAIAPRLRRYLEMIFVAGEWSTKPLFLRGIYFTSSMREGSALDSDLAEALGVSIESLPEGRVWERDRAYFLRDLFMQKVFKERGLVTQAGNVRRTQRRRRAVVMGAGLGTVVILIGLTILGGLAFRRSVGGQIEFWRSAADQAGTSPDSLKIVSPATATSSTFNYRGSTTLDRVKDAPRLTPFYGEAQNLAAQPLGVPKVFALVASFSRGLDQMRTDAARAVFEAGVVRPLAEAAARRLKDESARDWSAGASGALAQLIRLDTLAHQSDRPAGPSAIRIEPLLTYVVSDTTQFDQTTAADLQRTLDALYGQEAWGALAQNHATRDLHDVVGAAVPRFIEHWSSAAGGRAGKMGALQDLQAALATFDGAEARLLQLKGSPEPATVQEYDGLAAAWADAYKALAAARETVDKAIAALGAELERPAPELCAGAVTDLLARAKTEYDLLRESASAAPAETGGAAPPESALAETLKKGFEDLDAAARRNAAALGTELSRLQPAFIDRVKGSDSRLYALRAGMYAEAEARLQGATPRETPEFGELSRVLEAARTEADRSAAQIGSWQAAGAGLPRCDDAAALSKRMGAIASRRLTTACVAGLLRSAPGSGAEFVAKVAELAGRHPDLEPPRRPTLPMTGMDGGRFKAQFNPQIARLVLGDWGAVGRAIGTSEGVSDVLDVAKMREQAALPGRAYAAYAAEYVLYWSEVVPQEEAAFAVRDWPDFVEKARALKPPDANSEVAALLKLMGQALGTDVVPASLLQDPAHRSAKDRVANQLAVLDDRFDPRCRTLRDAWVGLGATQVAARDALLRVTAKRFEEEFLDTYGELGADRGKHVFYWNNFILAGLNALATGTEQEGREAIQWLQANAARYPLLLSDDRREVLTPEQVATARDMARRLPANEADPAGVPRRERDDPLALPFELRGRIAGGTVFRTEDERAWAAKVRTVLTFLGEAPQSCELVILDPQEQGNPVGSLVPAYPSPYRYLHLTLEQGPDVPPISLDATGTHDLRLRCPGPKAAIQFRSTLQAADDGSFALDDAWNAVRLAQAAGAQPDEKDKLLLKVPLRFKTGAGTEVYYWIGARFERPVPPRSDWPTRESWPAR